MSGGGDAQCPAVGGRARVGVRLALRALVRGVQRVAAAHGGHGGARVALDAQRPAPQALPCRHHAPRTVSIQRTHRGSYWQHPLSQRLGLVSPESHPC